MGERIQVRKPTTERAPEEVIEVEVPVREDTTPATNEVLDALDEALKEVDIDQAALEALLNEVDLILEKNAEEFVAKFQQRGGQ